MSAAKKTGVIQDPRYADHCTGAANPECSDRVAVLYDMLQESDMRGNFQDITPRPAEKEELLQVHSPEYIQRLEDTQGQAYTYLDPDTQASPFSHETALLAAGGLCRAIELVHAGKLDNAMALVRPPGHHAERSRAMGFCLYNNVAVGVRYAQSRLGLGRILLVDWDLHHGNGTQHCFEDDPSVLFFSVHQSAAYPGSGRFGEVGKGRGKGRTVNIPLRRGCGDAEYVSILEKILRPIALDFKPELILVSAGFDIHHNDPLGGMGVTPQGFAGLTRSVLTTADLCCEGKVVMTLEGGYDLDGLKDSVKAVLREMAGLQATDIEKITAGVDAKMITYLLWRVRRIHGRYYGSLRPSPGNGANPAPTFLERLRETSARIMDYLKN
ncbi:MAG: histone deacetylase [Desulfobacterales bacterium]|nr:MAG: histone deacetylase [Desulfobacterales bacterium]